MYAGHESDGSWAVMVVRVAVPVTEDGRVAPRWGKAERVAVVDVSGGVIRDWQEFDVGWARLHDSGTEGAHHARVARFLRERDVTMVAVEHLGAGMAQLLDKLGLTVRLGVTGDARAAILRLQ